MKTKLFTFILFSLCNILFSQGSNDTTVAEEQKSESQKEPIAEAEKPKAQTKLTLIKTLKIEDSIFEFRIDSKDATFDMQICKSDDCKKSVEYLKDMDPETFVFAVKLNLKNEFGIDLISESSPVGTQYNDSIQKILEKVKTHDEKEIRKELSEAKNILRSIDTAEDNYSGQLILNIDKNIPYQITHYKLKLKKLKEQLNEESLINNNIQNLSTKDEAAFMALDRESTMYQYLIIKAEEGKKAFIEDETIKEIFKNTTLVYYQVLSQRTESSKYCCKDFKSETSNGTGNLKVTSATVQFFNNKAATIKIRAELNESIDLIFINSEFSVPIRYFNIYGSRVSTFMPEKDVFGQRTKIEIDYNDIFDFLNYKDSYSYSVANDKKVLFKTEGKSTHKVKIEERRFFDFFTAIIYSDLMGFNTESPNSLVNAQARILMPLNLRNISKLTPIRQFTAVTNFSMQNSFDDENRFINIKDEEQFNNFDLLRKNNLYGKLSLEVLTHEAKGFFTNIGLGYSAGFYRTGFKLTNIVDNEEDKIFTKQLFSVAHGPYLNFEIRPQSNFGADITFSLEDLNYAGDDTINELSFSKTLLSNTGKDHFLSMPYNIINLEANFYWLTNPKTSVGGVYAKLGSYFHTDTNSIYPQFMVGYATNLTSFVDKFQSKKPIPAEEEETKKK
ncbi:hypothetical protein FPF71_16155 [Algibacter amylolyticus]|uniref:Uncharacterized protein n=1 Tax=Algibacter amylolyticus TaxID=1608400 RepID=A0A5M7AXM1_9FLAO|nr:hypothetical protein [Algibacter amylolyticus]KAA5821410.1 hypothetical protein F2B50_16155 [Algibacter amylolyticus]MBB5268282.1 hypothetical protein [Algibacter amylolyticus]TSJ72922.1 hypothetical protein FPF71_16155 [Algibacter amylolyticus]